jgi:hypothetical protein
MKEDLKALQSPKYIKSILKARKEKTVCDIDYLLRKYKLL